MPYSKALKHAGGAAVAVLKATPAGKAINAVTSLFGGGIDHRARSLKRLKKAVSSNDVALLERKATKSKYARVRGIAQQALVNLERGGPVTFEAAKHQYNAAKAAAAAADSAIGGAGPMQALPAVGAPISVSRTPTRRATAGRPRRRRRSQSAFSRMRRVVRRARARRKSRLKFGSPAWQRKYNPRRRRARR